MRFVLLLVFGSLLTLYSGCELLVSDVFASDPTAWLLLGQIDDGSGGGLPGTSVLGIGGIVIGVGTALAGILIPLSDRWNARQQALLDHEYRMRRLRSGCKDLCEWADAMVRWQARVSEIANERSILLPASPGDPPSVDFYRPASSDEIPTTPPARPGRRRKP